MDYDKTGLRIEVQDKYLTKILKMQDTLPLNDPGKILSEKDKTLFS